MMTMALSFHNYNRSTNNIIRPKDFLNQVELIETKSFILFIHSLEEDNLNRVENQIYISAREQM